MQQKILFGSVIVAIAGYICFVLSFATQYSMFIEPRWINLAVGVIATIVAVVAWASRPKN